MTNIAFVCVGNAGRSQMAAALAERERVERPVVQPFEIERVANLCLESL